MLDLRDAPAAETYYDHRILYTPDDLLPETTPARESFPCACLIPGSPVLVLLAADGADRAGRRTAAIM